MKNKNEEDEEQWRQKKGTTSCSEENKATEWSFHGQRVKGSNLPLPICTGWSWQVQPRMSMEMTRALLGFCDLGMSPGVPGREPLCPRYHILVQVCSASAFCWSLLRVWTLIESSLPTTESEGGEWSWKPGHDVSVLQKGSEQLIFLFELIFSAVSVKADVSSGSPWMDWSGRKTSSNTKHCRHFRSY